MIQSFRKQFNEAFSETKYQEYLSYINELYPNSLDFRIAETPLFLPAAFKNQLLEVGDYVCSQILAADFTSKTEKSLRNTSITPNEISLPECIVMDFAIAHNDQNEIVPALIELQGFPSLFAFEVLQDEALRNSYTIPENVTPYLNGYTKEKYLQHLSTIIKGEQGEHTVLLELYPEQQKTRIDFYCTQHYFAIPVVCITEIFKIGKALYYQREGIDIKIDRIYNRIVADELKKQSAEIKEKAEELQLEIAKKMLEQQSEMEEKGRAKEREVNMLREKEFQKQLEDQKKLIDEMKRKAEQGSMQLQGEIQELALEELLRTTYPFDQISEVGKGIRGADCMQTVINQQQQTCGTIIYESKRTKNFAGDWIDKLKQDQVNAKADLAVLVTETYPSDMDKFGQKDGVWICGFHEVKSLSLVLREMLLKTHSVRSSEENKGGKMEMLYKYLNGNEFIQTIQRILEVYTNMENDLNVEKRAMTRIWKTREKQIEVVALNISSMFGSIKGISGNDLASASFLELPESPTEEN